MILLPNAPNNMLPAHMTLASTFDTLVFEWPSAKTARLKIKDSVFTFAT